uniref:3-phosphoshikimate 1-carboxyvinyltransferase n=1 Tax=uncultured Chloroflexota bacterium TaxID=166587 RepID=H5SDW9_9CHLR|nr:3-phosphoshikimate 1-carboxyvinyltransferase [uncultured Chloroflexota bacterium]
MFSALAPGRHRLRGWLEAGDTRATLEAMKALGARISWEDGTMFIEFQGYPVSSEALHLDCRNSGTTIRLLSGLLAGSGLEVVLDGSEQLRRRPMRRVTEPLRAMGARIEDTEGRAPLYLHPASLHGAVHHLSVASAQVKSALLLAGCFAEGQTVVHEPARSRDHTERLLQMMGAPIQVSQDGLTCSIQRPTVPLFPLDITVPGDFSSAAFLIVAASLAPHSEIYVQDINLNPTRTGLLTILERMGAAIEILDETTLAGEPAATVRVRTAVLRGTQVGGAEIPLAIDELPILALAATQAEGETVIRDAAELRVKETDRIHQVCQILRAFGAEVEELPDGMVIYGPRPLHGAHLSSLGDHRLGMLIAVAGLIARGETLLEDEACTADSFPGFFSVLMGLGASVA